MYSIHNQKFDFVMPGRFGQTQFCREDGFVVSTNASSRMTSMALGEEVLVSIPDDARGEGFLAGAERAEKVYEALDSLWHTSSSNDEIPTPWQPFETADHVRWRNARSFGCYTQSVKPLFPVDGASAAPTVGLKSGTDHNLINHGVGHVVVRGGEVEYGGTRVRRWKDTIDVSVNRKAANAAYKVFRDGAAEGASMRGCFSEEFARSNARREYEVMTLCSAASDDYIRAAGVLSGARGVSAAGMSANHLLSEVYRWVSYCKHILPGDDLPGYRNVAARHRTHLLDAFIKRGVLRVDSEFMDAFFSGVV